MCTLQMTLWHGSHLSFQFMGYNNHERIYFFVLMGFLCIWAILYTTSLLLVVHCDKLLLKTRHCRFSRNLFRHSIISEVQIMSCSRPVAKVSSWGPGRPFLSCSPLSTFGPAVIVPRPPNADFFLLLSGLLFPIKYNSFCRNKMIIHWKEM